MESGVEWQTVLQILFIAKLHVVLHFLRGAEVAIDPLFDQHGLQCCEAEHNARGKPAGKDGDNYLG